MSQENKYENYWSYLSDKNVIELNKLPNLTFV